MRALSEYIKQGEKNVSGQVGVEVEHFLLDRSTGRPLEYGRLEPFLKTLVRDHPDTVYEEGHLIQLENDHALITLEPGCQLELSLKYTDDISKIDQWYAEEMRPIEAIEGCDIVYSGGLPTVDEGRVKRILKKRYAFMERWFSLMGERGREMMKATASVHISIDYKNEKDFVRKMRVAAILHPLLAFLMANTPKYAGKENEDILLRDSIWHHTDKARCGTIPTLFDEDFGYDGYARWLEKVPVILMKLDDTYIYEGPMTIAQAGEKYGRTDAHMAHFFSMAFPDVRAKQIIEIRSADSVEREYMTAYAALIKGLFYDDGVLDEVIGWAHSIDELDAVSQNLRKLGWDADAYGQSAQNRLKRLLERAGISLPETEKHYLAPLEACVQKRKHIYELEA